MPNRRDTGNYHNLRLSSNNPQHIRVDQILNDLNLNIYKSKNQFMADAIETYAKLMNQDELTIKATIEKARKESFVSRKDLEVIKREVADEVIKMVQKEVISMLGTALAAKQAAVSTGIDNKAVSDNEAEEEVSEEVINLAGVWG